MGEKYIALRDLETGSSDALLTKLFSHCLLNSCLYCPVLRDFHDAVHEMKSAPEVIKLFSCSTQLSMLFKMLISIKISRNSAFSGSDKPRMLFFPLINVKMPTIVGI